MKKVLYNCIAVVISLLLLSACKGMRSNQPSKESIDKVKAQIVLLEKYLPIEGGVGMVITDVDYDDANNVVRYKYQYTVPGVKKPTESKLKEAKQTVVSITKSIDKERKVLEEGISFHYDYYSLEGEYLYSVDLTKDDIMD